MEIVDPRIETYMEERLRRFDGAGLPRMEAYGEEHGFPIVGRNVGVTLELLARSVGARRIMELGSGYRLLRVLARACDRPRGRSAPDRRRSRQRGTRRDYLEQAGLAERTEYHVGDAVTEMGKLDGDFDVVFCDIDKDGYPDAWRAASRRIRVGGALRLRQRALVRPSRRRRPRRRAPYTEPSSSTTAWSPRMSGVSTIVPTRDGVLVATRVE